MTDDGGRAYSPEAPALAPPGWYVDPTDPRLVRWWDGSGWTGHVRQPAAPDPPQPQPQPAPVTALAAAGEPEPYDAVADHWGTANRFGISGFGTEECVVTTLPPDAGAAPRRVGPVGAVVSAVVRVLDYGGRSSPSEFWWFSLVSIMISTAVLLVRTPGSNPVDALLLLDHGGQPDPWWIACIVVLGVLNLPLTIRRLHDGGHAGSWILLNLVPVLTLVTLVMLLDRSEPQRNRFGPARL